MLCNGLSRYEQALTAAQQASEDSDAQWFANWALAELVEAAGTADPGGTHIPIYSRAHTGLEPAGANVCRVEIQRDGNGGSCERPGPRDEAITA